MTCGQHIKVLSFPYSRVPSTLVEMLHYCCNVQHLSLPLTELGNEQLKKIMCYMGLLQTLELKVQEGINIEQLLLDTAHLKELKIISDDANQLHAETLYHKWWKLAFRPSKLKVFAVGTNFGDLARLATGLTIPTDTTANFRVYNRHSKEPFNFAPCSHCYN